jgi:hypothetical protein
MFIMSNRRIDRYIGHTLFMSPTYIWEEEPQIKVLPTPYFRQFEKGRYNQFGKHSKK